MNKLVKIILSLICVISFTSCKKNTNDTEYDSGVEEISYPSYAVSEYEKMDKYEYSETMDNIKYKYTYFFVDGLCVNAKEELTFSSENEAKDFYKEIVDSEDYMEIKISGKTVSYYNNPEYFIYVYYPKDVLINLLNSADIES